MIPVLDTHVLLRWLIEPRRLSRRQKRILDGAGAEHPALLSDISLWEVGLLVADGSVVLGTPLREWLSWATARPAIQRCEISPEIAADAAYLPSTIPNDPADRIIVATTRMHGGTLLTSDRRIIEAGAVPTIA